MRYFIKLNKYLIKNAAAIEKHQFNYWCVLLTQLQKGFLF